jgi:hypothetical protein
MVIWPGRVSLADNDWRRACALLLLLPLDTRVWQMPSRASGGIKRFFIRTTDGFLKRPEIWVNQRPQLAPYFEYELCFAVSASVHGRIPISDEEALIEFRRAVDGAISGELTAAERRRWEAHDHEAGRTAHRHYDEQVRAGKRHEEALESLIQLGLQMLPPPSSSAAAMDESSVAATSTF